jgi:hypothetical protein
MVGMTSVASGYAALALTLFHSRKTGTYDEQGPLTSCYHQEGWAVNPTFG